MPRRKCTHKQIIEAAKRSCRGNAKPFVEEAELLESARVLFELRWGIVRDFEAEGEDEAVPLEKRARRRLHHRIRLSSSDLRLVGIFRQRRLNQVEQEILLLLVVSGLGMCRPADDAEDIQEALFRKGRSGLEVARALTEVGRLATSGLIAVGDEDLPTETRITVSPSLIAAMLKGSVSPPTWRVRTQDELLDRSYLLIQKLRERAELLGAGGEANYWSRDELPKLNRTICRLFETLARTLARHPSWPLHRVNPSELCPPSRLMLVALLGKELGFLSPAAELFSGAGLARCASESVPEVRHRLLLLRKDAALRQAGYIRVSGGYGDSTAVEDEATLMACEFELTQDFLDRIKIKRRRRSSTTARSPQVKPKQLVLPESVRRALDLAIAQVRHGKILTEDWGVAETVPYGRSVTMLFSGPPGVGKTACAEAVAHELDRPILAVSYAEIQNCFVGETEKNIVRVFREAKNEEAVLFWDEADSMFYDRDSAYRNWEVRDINVLLMELERFEGLCVLSSNRKVVLDRALERRIAIKVEFEPPDRDLRKQIWKRLIPAKMPLARDVDLDQLSLEELTGGEIKNAILNAARTALARTPQGPVAMSDFAIAVQMEREGKWSEKSDPIGFISVKR